MSTAPASASAVAILVVACSEYDAEEAAVGIHAKVQIDSDGRRRG